MWVDKRDGMRDVMEPKEKEGIGLCAVSFSNAAAASHACQQTLAHSPQLWPAAARGGWPAIGAAVCRAGRASPARLVLLLLLLVRCGAGATAATSVARQRVHQAGRDADAVLRLGSGAVLGRAG